MKIRRTLTIAAATIALTAGLTPAASAQGLGDLLGGANQVIDNFDCGALRVGLTQTGLVNDQTTRTQLATTLRNTADLGQIDPVLGFAGNAYAGRIADRALTCGIVQPDPPQDILTQLQTMSSNLSSGAILEQFLPAQ